MPTSQLVCSALVVTPTVRGNAATWLVSGALGALYNVGMDVVELWASTTNDRATAAKVVEGAASALHAGLIEETTYFYWIKARDRLGNYGDWYPSGSTSGVSARAVGMAGLVFGLANGNIDATASGNALTIVVRTASGGTPSSTDPVYVGFRKVTPQIGYSILGITSALTLTISSGSTLGASSGPFRIWVLLFNDGGTLRIGVKNCNNGLGSISTIEDNATADATAEGGAGAADSNGVFYASQAISGKAYRVIGYLEFLAGWTPGNWVNPNTVALYNVGGPLPGEPVQQYLESIDTSVTTTNTSTLSGMGTTTGVQMFASASFSAKSRCNFMEIDVLINVSHSVDSDVAGAVCENLGSLSLAFLGWCWTKGGSTGQIRMFARRAVSANLVGFQIRVAPVVAGTLTVNGVGGVNRPGYVSTLSIKEIQG